MNGSWATIWVANKLKDEPDITTIDVTSIGLLKISRKDYPAFKAAALGIEDRVMEAHVAPFFAVTDKPQFVVNVPSKAIWTGPAIDLIHRVLGQHR